MRGGSRCIAGVVQLEPFTAAAAAQAAGRPTGGSGTGGSSSVRGPCSVGVTLVFLWWCSWSHLQKLRLPHLRSCWRQQQRERLPARACGMGVRGCRSAG